MQVKIRYLFTKQPTLCFFFIINMFWLPYVIMTFPGNIAFDSGSGIAYFLNIDRSNPNNPYFQTILMGLFYSLGNSLGQPSIGVGVYCGLQLQLEIYLLSAILTKLLQVIRRKYVLIFVIAIYAIIPAFPIHAFTMAKDSSFALSILWFLYLIWDIVDCPEEIKYQTSKQFLIPLCIILMGLLRNHAWFVPAASFFVFAVFSVRDKRIIILAASTLMISFCLSNLVVKWTGYGVTEIRESMAVPLQTTAYYVNNYPQEITDEEKETIQKVVDLDILKNYDRNTADPIKNRSYFTEKTTKEFLSMWGRMVLRRPGIFIKCFVENIDIYFLPGAKQSMKPHIHVGYEIDDKMKIALNLYNYKDILATVWALDEFFLSLPLFHVFSKIGLYTWTMLISFIIAMIQKKWKYALCYAPLFMVLIGCMLSPINGYYRYAYPMILSVPLLTTKVLCQKQSECCRYHFN